MPMEGNGYEGTPQAPSNPAVSGNPAPQAPADSQQLSGDFTAEQLSQMADWMVQDGRMTADQAREALLADGIAPPKARDTVAPAAAEVDRAFPPARPEEYHLPRLTREGDSFTPSTAETDRAIRGWLSEARFTKEIGSALAGEVDRVFERYSTMSQVQQTTWAKQQEAQLRGLFGDQYDSKVGLARQLVNELEAKSPGIKSYLDRSGASNSAFVVAQVVMQAERLLARRGGKV